jgi:citrate/tricarballylate utilization protein
VSSTEPSSTESSSTGPSSTGPFDDLFAEAARQLAVCNSCRYCAGYCPVWPALELRTDPTKADVTHLANLCHDCRDCFTACMYTAPHEFDLNPPAIFTRAREHTYEHYVRPPRLPRVLRGRTGLVVGFLLVSAVLVALSIATTGGVVFGGPATGSPYELVAYGIMVTAVAIPSLWTVGVMAAALARYWRDTHGSLRDLLDAGAWCRALRQAATLRHQTGGGEHCAYEENEPSTARRGAHQAVMYGFLLTFVSTVSAAFMENVLGLHPPYPYFSVPVVTGSVGGVLASVGCVVLIRLKRRADAAQTTPTMLAADHGLLWALLVIMVSGLAVTVTRTTVAFGPLLVVHLAAVVVAFAVAPYTKFFHWTYRLLAIYKDALERRPATVTG